MTLEPDLSHNRHNSEILSKRVSTLKKRSEFLRLRNGKRCSTKSLILQSLPIEQNACEATDLQVGYTVTKKVGNSVVRNRVKRRLRAAVTHVFPQKAQSSHNYVIIGKHGALTQSFASILKDMEQALDHVHKNRSKDTHKPKHATLKTKEQQQD